MSSITEKRPTMPQSSQSHSWQRCAGLFVIALTGLAVGLWRSHLLVDASGLGLLLFLSITLPMVGLAVLVVWGLQHFLDSQAKSRTAQLEPFSRQFGSVRVLKLKTKKTTARKHVRDLDG